MGETEGAQNERSTNSIRGGQILRVDDTTVRRWVKQGALEAVVLPHLNARQAYRIKRKTLDRVLGEAALAIS